jgi:tRNA threonylcarbamoyladenosine biosynthesis protein TsaB
MSIILSIDTALPLAAVSLSNNGALLTERISELQKEHAAFLHPAIESVLLETGITLNELDAVAVTIGPGSYTGLRVGLASAKGLCFGLKKPLIPLCTLETLAFQSRQSATIPTEKILFCPMIDARRMEVFTALFESDMTCMIPPHALILNQDSFKEYLTDNILCFSGNGSDKFMETLNHENARQIRVSSLSNAMAQLGFSRFEQGDFTNMKTLEPNYIKGYQA